MTLKERNENLKAISFELGDTLGGSTCRDCTKSYCCEHQNTVGISHLEFDEVMHLVTLTQIKRAEVELQKLESGTSIECNGAQTYRCPFLAEAGGCEIYDDRFIVCATYSVVSKEHNCSASLCDKGSCVDIVDPNAIIMGIISTSRPTADKIVEVVPDDASEGTDVLEEFKKRYSL